MIGIALVAMVAAYAVFRQSDSARPCRKVMEACRAAGFKRGSSAKQRRDFFHSCVRPLMEKGSIGSVQIDPKDALSCKQKRAKRHRSGDV
jgi:hypothetical protein